MNDTVEKINELRAVMGTLPTQAPELKTEFRKGVEGISVELIEYPTNPYKAMYVLATSCWGSKINKWEDTLPEHRFLVVKAVLERDALPLALESVNFTFAVEGPSRAAFDQLARTRIGAVFSAKGMRDNNWKDCSIRIPTSLWNDESLRNMIMDQMDGVKALYAHIVDQGKGSWQAARMLLPLYVVYGYSVSYNYAALLGVCANRMKFCEMEDTVAVAWLTQRAVYSKFPLLGSYLRPGCDKSGSCQYHKSYGLSELFGCLFAECGRNPCPGSDGYAEFNETCTNYSDLEEQLGIHITRPDEWPNYNTFESLAENDRILFEAE